MRFALACEADGLAGEATGKDVDRLRVELGADVADVAVDVDVGPVVTEYLPAEGVDLAHPAGLHSSPLESKVETPDTGEQRADGEHVTGPRPGRGWR